MKLTNKQFVLKTMKAYGKNMAQNVQQQSDSMTGTQLYEKKEFIPDFQTAKTLKNMLNRSIGFVCKSTAGRVVKLIQPYDSDIYSQEPEELSAQWGFKWSTNPEDALPFIALATSPYDVGECCIENDIVYRSKIPNNVFSPSSYPQGWEVVN